MNLENYLKNIIVEFQKMKTLADKAMVQVSDNTQSVWSKQVVPIDWQAPEFMKRLAC